MARSAHFGRRSFFPPSFTLAILASLAAVPIAGTAQAADSSFSAQVDRCGYDPLHDIHFRLHYEGGEMAGQPEPYTLFGAFAPTRVHDGLVFVDSQLVLDNDGEVSCNIGLGRRWYHECTDSIFGASLWYDGDHTQRGNDFHQVGVSLEWLFNRWDFRANVYAPVGTRVKDTGATAGGSGEIRFEGNNLVYGMQAMYDTALGGVDLEAARRFGELNLWAFAGTYHYDGPGLTTWGAKGGVRGYVTDNLAASLTITDDDLFDTTVAFGVTWFLPSGNRRGSSPCSNCARLYTPVRRNDYIVVHETAIDSLAVLTDGGAPITLAHVNDDGVGTGTGTFEDPYGSLTDAGGSGADIVFVHADSVFDGQHIWVEADKRLLGEGIDHYVDTAELGTVLMPRATAGTAVPVIRNAPVTAISCGRNAEVSGFTVEDPNGMGISADDGNVTITRNTVSGASWSGITAHGWAGDFFDAQVTNNTVSDCQGMGISVLAAGDGTINVSDNISNNNGVGTGWGVCGIHIQANANMNGTVANNVTNGNALDGIEIVGPDAISNIDLAITGNMANNNEQFGIYIANRDGTTTATISENTLQNNDSGGLSVHAINGTASLDVLDNTMGGSTWGAGMTVQAAQLDGTISGNTFEDNTWLGCMLHISSGGTGGDVTFSNNDFSGNNSGSNEFFAEHVGSGTFTLRMGDNTSTNTPPNPPGNYQLQNAGTGTFDFIDEGGNVGTFSGP